MNSIIIKKRLSALYVTIRESKSQSYLNPSIIWIIYTGMRLSLLLRVNQFNGKEYKDKQLILIKDIINWIHLFTPINSIKTSQFEYLIVVLIAIFHLLSLLITLFNNNQTRFANSFQNQYFTYLQMLYLCPSFLYIHQLQYLNEDKIIMIICIVLIILNYLIFTYIQRNYLLPSNNPFIKRYHLQNYVVNSTEIIALVLIPYFDEIFQSIILLIQYLIQLCDSIFNQPFTLQINLKYCISSSILFYCSIFKCLSIYWTEMEFLYFCFIFVPLLTVITNQILQQIYDQNIENLDLDKQLIIQIIDEYHQNNNNLIRIIILYKMKTKYQILNNTNTLTSDQQFNDYIFIMFNRLIESLPTQEKYLDEDLYIYIIMFLYFTNNKQNLAYIRIKQFQIYHEYQTLYFHILEEFCQQSIQKRIQKKVQQQQGRLELQQIKQSQILQDRCQIVIDQILEQKIKYWDQLSKGYENIEQLCEASINLSEKVIKLRNLVFKELDLKIFMLSKELFKLNLIDLRLLSQIFATILNDYHITRQIEQRIEDILNVERNMTSKNITNIDLLNDDVIIIPISMIKNKGQILSQNKQKLFKYFKMSNYDSNQQIVYIDSIMPQYLQKKHDRFLNKFLLTGESSLFINSEGIYPQYYNGFSFSATLQLISSYDQVDDYILSAVLKKSTDNYDFILFDESGKIIGITESIQQLLLSNSKELMENELYNDILKSYIYFWFKDLLLFMNDQQDAFIRQYSSQESLNNQSTIIQPIINLKSLIKDHESFRKQHHMTQTNTLKTDQDLEIDQKQNIKISCFEQNYVNSTNEFMNDKLLNNHLDSIYFQVTFTVHLKQMQSYHPIFILTINEFMQKEQKQIGNSLYSSVIKTATQLGMKSECQTISEQNVEEMNQELLINQTIVNKLLIKHPNELLDKREVDQKDEDLNVQIIIDKDQKESNLISPRSNREILIQKGLIEEDSEYIRGNESNIKSSSQKYIKENIQQVVLQEQNIDFAQEKQSKSSATSDKTQNSIYNIMRKLQYTQQYYSSIINAIYITTILTIFLIILEGVELSILRDHTNQLKYSIPLVRIPQRFNRLFCTFITIGQLELQSKLLNQSYGDYYDYRIKNESASKREEIQSLMTEIITEFSQMEDQEQLPILEIRIINEYLYQIENVSMIAFDTLVNAYTDQLNKAIQITDQDDQAIKRVQILLSFLKGNLINQLDFTIAIVNQIEDNFYNLIQINYIEELVFLIIILFIIFTMLILQFNQWLQPYRYMQVILLLIGKISDRDIEFSQSRMYFLLEKHSSNVQHQKNINYFRDFFWQSKKSLNYLSLRISSQGTSKNKNNGKYQQQRVKQTQRIQETSFSIKNIEIMLLFLWGLLSSYAIGAFIIMQTNMNNSQPELNIAMEFVKFKQDLDGVMIICQLLKSQQILIDETMASGIFKLNPELSTKDKYFTTLYNELLAEFSPLINNMDGIYSTIYKNVIESKKISKQNKELLLNLYEQDLCEIIPTILPFCAYENGKFQYFPSYPSANSNLNNKQIYRYGINGIYQQIISIFNTYYSIELNGIKDSNLTNVQSFLQSTEYVQTILPYFFDLSYAILQFYYTIIQSALDILENDYQMVLQFSIIAGIGCITIFYIIILLRAITLQKKVRLIRQALILIPYESLQDLSILHSIRNIDRKF